MKLRLYNTLSRGKEDFAPADGKTALLYHCGPTVYHYAHIGNLRAFIFSDLLRRAIEMAGYDVKQVMNITDVGHLVSDGDTGEDKMEKGAKREGQSAKEIADFYSKAFFADLEKLHIKPAHFYPRATEHIKEQLDLIKKLEKKGFTYQTSDGVYFDTSKYSSYDELGNLNLSGQESGARVLNNPEKRNPSDFALWKFSKKGERRQQEWWAPWPRDEKNSEKHEIGISRAAQVHTMENRDARAPEPRTQQSAEVYGAWGFPGWHVECSAMAMKYLGETLDIHTGGIDHIPVHHTNERAQSVCATGKPFARFWMHSGFVNIGEEKMAKSDDNFLRLESLIQGGYQPLSYRYLLLTAHYRRTISFDFEALRGAQTALQRIYDFLVSVPEEDGTVDASFQNDFRKAIEDDLDTPNGLSILWDVIKDSTLSDVDKKATILSFDEVLGLDFRHAEQYIPKQVSTEDLPKDVRELCEEREEARERKDFDESDRLRDLIESLGYEIEDGKEGTIIKKCP